MANNQLLKDAIAQVVKTNGNNEITGQILQDALVSIINQFGAGAIFGGFAVPETVPINGDFISFYVANTNGIYPNFGGYVLENNDIVIFTNKSGSFSFAGKLSMQQFISRVNDITYKLIRGKNLFDINDFLPDTSVSSDGGLQVLIGRKTSKPIAINEALPYVLTTSQIGNKRGRFLYADLTPLPGQGDTMGAGVFSDPPNGAAYFQFTFKLESETDAQVSQTQFEQNAVATAFVPYVEEVRELLSIAGNVVVTRDDVLALIPKVGFGKMNDQLFDKLVFNENQFISTASGSLNIGTGFRTGVIKKQGQETNITISGLVNPQSGKAWRFEDKNGLMIGNNWAVITSNPVILSWPVGATQLRFTFKRDTDALTAGDTVMVNTGNTPKPYQSYIGDAVVSILDTLIRAKVADSLIAGATMNGLTIATTDQIPDVSAIKAKTDAFILSYPPFINVLNPNTYEIGAALTGSQGTTQVSAIYDTSDYAPVDPNSFYKAINQNETRVFRIVSFYNSSKNWISTLNDPAFIGEFTTPVNAAYMRGSVFKTIGGAGIYNNDKTKIGVFKGANPVFSAFGAVDVRLKDISKQTSEKGNDYLATMLDVKNMTGSLGNSPIETVSFAYSSGILKVTQSNGDYIRGVLNADRGYNGNNMFNFVDWSVRGKGKANGDDVAPTHSQNTTMGANHAQPVALATVANHGLTNLNIGDQWLTAGNVRFYVMRIVDANTLVFLSHNIGTRVKPSFNILTVGNLTRNGVTLAVTAVNTSNQQLFSSITNLSKRVIADGYTEVLPETLGVAKYVDVIERYDIMSIDDILNNIIARSGTGNNSNPVYIGAPMLRIENIYRFLPNCSVVVLVNVKALEPVDLADIMGSQAIIIGTETETQYYVPNSAPTGIHDFRKPLAVAWTGSVLASDFFTVSSSPDPLNPPNRVIQYYDNIGFMLGFLKTRGTGKALQNFTLRTFELRNNTGKVYPHGVEGGKMGATMPANEVYNMVMIRSFTDLSETRTGNRLSYFNFTFEGTEFVFVDYSGSMFDKVNVKKPKLNGKLIEVLEAKNVTLKSDTYNDGVYLSANYIEGETSFIVLTIK